MNEYQIGGHQRLETARSLVIKKKDWSRITYCVPHGSSRVSRTMSGIRDFLSVEAKKCYNHLQHYHCGLCSGNLRFVQAVVIRDSKQRADSTTRVRHDTSSGETWSRLMALPGSTSVSYQTSLGEAVYVILKSGIRICGGIPIRDCIYVPS